MSGVVLALVWMIAQQVAPPASKAALSVYSPAYCDDSTLPILLHSQLCCLQVLSLRTYLNVMICSLYHHPQNDAGYPRRFAGTWTASAGGLGGGR